METKCIEEADGFTLRFLAPNRPFIGKFLLEMVTKSGTADHFSLQLLEGEGLLLNAHFNEAGPEFKAQLERTLHEIELGVRSPYHAARILEMKALSMDEKRALVQDQILGTIRRFPHLFDYDLFSEMQQFFLAFSDQYFRCRTVFEVAETLRALYTLRKKVFRIAERCPGRRHAEVKVMRRTLSYPLEQKEALEITVAMNVLKENEVFKKNHLLKAVQNILPKVTLIVGSDYQEKEAPLHLLTIEVEKEGGFEIEEIADLKRWLPRTLKGKIEHLQHTLFMPRNEEEILRNVITLGRELRFARDLPQVILSFENQTETGLVFTVILARILLPDAPPLEDVLLASPLRPKIDRIKQLGILRKKYPKEAAVFKVELPNAPFLREDRSIDLYKARQTILKKLKTIFGEIRDYNGGMISKQDEVFKGLEKVLGEVGKTENLLLENFFHSLFPLEKRSLIDPEVLGTFFLLLVEKVHAPQPFLSKEEGGYLFLVGERDYIEKVQPVSNPLITLDLEDDEKDYFGIIASLG